MPPAPRLRLSVPAALALLAAAMWILYAIMLGDPWLARGEMSALVYKLCVAASGAAAVVAAGELALAWGPAAGRRATGLQRVMLYGVLSFAGSFLVLRWLGVDLTAVLATSAIVSAAVALAVQPTIGSLISGLALHADGILQVGDTAIVQGEEIAVTAMNWRAIVGLRRDGGRTVLSNARVSDGTLQVYRRGSPVLVAMEFTARSTTPPWRVASAVGDMLCELADADPARPVAVTPGSAVSAGPGTIYLAEFWIQDHARRVEALAQARERIWYVLDRNRFASGVDEERATPPPTEFRIPPALLRDGERLVFGPGERLTLPERCAGWRLVLLSGAVLTTRPSRSACQSRSKGALIEAMTQELAGHIGPYAAYAVGQAAGITADVQRLRLLLAAEIEDAAARAAFLAHGEDESAPAYAVGSTFAARADLGGGLRCDPPAWAAEEVMLLGGPAALSGVRPRAGRKGGAAARAQPGRISEGGVKRA
jgi:hypothetical protein